MIYIFYIRILNIKILKIKKLSANARVLKKTLDIAIIFFYKNLSFYKKIEKIINNNIYIIN